MRSETLFYFVVTFFISNYIDGIKGCNNVEVYNNSDNSLKINVTAWNKRNKIHYRIIDVNVTWSQALDICKTMKYGNLANGLPGWSTRINVRKYLEGFNYNNLDYTFWIRAFRPHLHVREWFSSIESCTTYPYLSKVVKNHEDGRCAAIKRNETDFFNETVFAENCNQRKPFVCVYYYECIDLLAYTGFDVIKTPTGASLRNWFNVSLDNCQTKCINDSSCNSFTYVNLTETCNLFRNRKGYGTLNYTIYKSNMSDVTHYVKTGSIIEYISNVSHIAIPTDTPDLPDCGIDEMPPGYCKTNSEEDVEKINDIAAEIVKNLTVDKKATSSFRRKVTSSTDERNFSKAFGSLGLIIIIATLSLFVTSDVYNYFNRSTGKIKKDKSESTNREVRA